MLSESTRAPETSPVPDGPRVAYIMSRFPKLTETFILYEIQAVEQLGVQVEIYPLLRERQRVRHAEAQRWEARARFQPFLSLPILAAQWHFVRRRPGSYFRVLSEVLRGTWGSRNFFMGAIGIFAKTVHNAHDMQTRGVQHVHAHFATHPALAALIVHRLTGIPFSFTAHGSDLHVDRRMLERKVQAAAFAVAISNYNRDVILKECTPWARDKVHVVHCGVDPEVFQPRAAPIDDAPFRILCVASFEEVKGHRYLVEACAMLRQQGVDFACDLVGEGPLRARVEAQIAAAGLAGAVRLLGARPRDAVARLLSESHVLVLPSVQTAKGKREGIPVVLMEGMASGLPVVASRISGVPELVDHGVSGLLVAPRDAGGLAEALLRLQRAPELRQRLGRAGRDKVLQQFELRSNAAILARLFEPRSAVVASS